MVAHEIAHNITWADNKDKHLLAYSAYVGDDPRLTFTWKPGSYAWEDHTDYKAEFSADLIANLALDGFNAPIWRDEANAWMVANIWGFVGNMNCMRAGNGAGCVDW